MCYIYIHFIFNYIYSCYIHSVAQKTVEYECRPFYPFVCAVPTILSVVTDWVIKYFEIYYFKTHRIEIFVFAIYAFSLAPHSTHT